MPRVKVPVPQQPTFHHQPSTEVMEAPAQVHSGTPKRPLSQRLTKEQWLFTAVGVMFLILIIALFSVMHSKNQLQAKVDKLSSNSATANQNEVNQLTQQISQFFQLPTGETPTLATVSDASKVRNQAFFKDAQNGDKVLLYSKAGEAILYRPSTKKIIAVAPVNLSGSDTTNSSTSTTNVAK